MEIVDRVLFRMPRDREMQFSAVAIVQQYVNQYAIKHKRWDVEPEKRNTYLIEYMLDMPDVDKQRFKALDLKMVQEETVFDGLPTGVFNFTEETAQALYNPLRHIAQSFAALCGMGKAVFPFIGNTVKPKLDGEPYWVHLDSVHEETQDGIERELIAVKDGMITGVIGESSYLTYLAANRGLPVVEIIPKDRSVHYMSKFVQPYWRPVIQTDEPIQMLLIANAMKSIEDHLKYDLERGAFNESTETKK